jgi:hypothetical protein
MKHKLKLSKKLNLSHIQMKYKFNWNHAEIFFLDDFCKKCLIINM